MSPYGTTEITSQKNPTNHEKQQPRKEVCDFAGAEPSLAPRQFWMALFCGCQASRTGRSMDKRTLHTPIIFFAVVFPRLSLTKPNFHSLLLCSSPLCFQHTNFSVEKDALPLKISWIYSPGRGRISGKAEIHRLVPDL